MTSWSRSPNLTCGLRSTLTVGLTPATLPFDAGISIAWSNWNQAALVLATWTFQVISASSAVISSHYLAVRVKPVERGTAPPGA